MQHAAQQRAAAAARIAAVRGIIMPMMLNTKGVRPGVAVILAWYSVAVSCSGTVFTARSTVGQLVVSGANPKLCLDQMSKSPWFAVLHPCNATVMTQRWHYNATDCRPGPCGTVVSPSNNMALQSMQTGAVTV